MREARVIVVGGGPAGLFAAIRASVAGSVILLEGKRKPGIKLLASGSGQCNITHGGDIGDFPGRYGGGAKPGSAARFLKPALYAFDNRALLAWFAARGVEFIEEPGGKVFPSDRRASSILDALLAECARLGVEIVANARVSEISAGPGFVAGTGGENPLECHAPALVLATGGASWPRTGSAGDGYRLAAALGHGIVPPRPALAPLIVRNHPLAGLSGLSFGSARLSVRRGGVRVLERSGELLVTHDGLSGPLVLDASRWIEPGDTVETGFSELGREDFARALDAGLSESPRRLVVTVASGLGLPRSMAERFCELAGIGPEERAASLTRAKRDALCDFACAFPLEAAEVGGMEVAMATAGGVDLAEVDSRSMGSRIAPGLFFAGELLDADGATGGYNLQAAFSTGSLAGTKAAAWAMAPALRDPV